MKAYAARTVKAALLATVGFAVAAGAAQAAPSGLNAYTVPDANPKALRALAQQGFDLNEGRSGGATEIVATAEQARGLSKFGVSTTPAARGATATAQSIRPDGSYDVFRPYFDHTFVGTIGGVPGAPARETLFEEYTRIAEAEERHWWYQATRSLACQFLEPHLQEGAHLLDAGCGPGGNSTWWQGRGPVTGLDLSPEAIRLAQANHPALEAVEGDLMAMPFADGSFDAALVLTVLALVADDAAALSELHRVLRPGGTAFVLEPANQWLWRDHDTVTHARRRYRLADLRRKAETAGFSVRRATYAYSFLLPPAAGLSVLNRLRPAEADPLSDLQRDRLGGGLGRLARAERRFLRRRDLPTGLSAVILITRQL